MAAPSPILDENHLARQTFGDRELEREVLDLFAEQLERLPSKLRDADAGERGALLHGLKGSARAVGAMALAQLAEALEGSRTAEADELLDMLAATLSALAARTR